MSLFTFLKITRSQLLPVSLSLSLLPSFVTAAWLSNSQVSAYVENCCQTMAQEREGGKLRSPPDRACSKLPLPHTQPPRWPPSLLPCLVLCAEQKWSRSTSLWGKGKGGGVWHRDWGGGHRGTEWTCSQRSMASRLAGFFYPVSVQ